MEINNNNFTKQLESIYSKLEEINKNYEKLENKQKESERIIEINKTNILRLNKNLNIVNNSLLEFKSQYDKEFNKLKNNLSNKNEIKLTNDIEKINVEQINQLNAKFDGVIEGINKRFYEFDKIINELKNAHNNKIENQEIKIEKKDNQIQSLIQGFNDVLSSIINNNNIDKNHLEELKDYSKNLINNNLYPIELSNKYFSEIYKKLHYENKLNAEEVSKIAKISEITFETIEKICSELSKNSKKTEKKKPKKLDIKNFRKLYGIKEEDADDKTIKDLYKKCDQDEFKTYQNIILRLVDKLNKK